VLNDIFELDRDTCEGKGKIAPLSDAISKTIKPGMKLHINTGAYANAAIREVIRQFWKKDPKFTLISSGVTTPYKISLVLGGLATKVIMANYSYTYPTPKPIPLFQKMVKEGLI
jgi:hypothetical protein